MKRKQLVLTLFFGLFASANGFSQLTLVCNDLVEINLDDCFHTIEKEEILEGSYCLTCDYSVELDKTPPLGNGPWLPPDLSVVDLGKLYMVRVRELSSSSTCWGNVKVGEKIVCTNVTTVNLTAGNPVLVTPADLQINFEGDCAPVDAASSTLNNGQSSVTYGCADLGVHILQVTAHDQFGNTSDCQTTVVVDDPLSECSACLACPPATQVSFEQGGSALAPAFAAGDWSVFDAYGNGTYSCAFADSNYTVEYHKSPYGQNWFERRWEGLDAGGQVVASCHQIITFPFYNNISVGGKVYIDTLPDCSYNTGEPGTSLANLRATVLPSNTIYTTTPDANGLYNFFDLTLTGVDSAVLVQAFLPNGLTTVCANSLLVPANTTAQTQVFDIGLRTDLDCPKMQVSLDGTLMRRCQNNLLYVKYCNLGLMTAENAYINVRLDTLLQFQNADIPWSGVNGNTYTFQLGDVPPLSCEHFTIVAHLDCNAQIGKTVCNDATIFPHTPCTGTPWDGPVVATTAYCSGDSVFLAVWNKGNQPMATPQEYIIIEDVIMYRQDQFQLNAGDSITIRMPGDKATWRIEAQQVSGYPEKDSPSAAVEDCKGVNTTGLINAFPQNDEPLYFDTYCTEVRASCDPNDKSAVPTGYGTYNTIRANTDLEYKIRFQNTGNDTAFRVVIVDTLPSLLNPATLEAGVGSHPYRLDVFPGGILHFVFDPIALPDSNVNEVASHGFVTFRIAQKPDLPDGAEINNKAAIYFDFNDPVITNTAFHTIGQPFVTVEVDDPVAPGVTVAVQPNPFRDAAVVRLEGTGVRQGVFILADALGKVVRMQNFRDGQCTLERNGLPAGLYFFRIDVDGAPVAHGKVQAY